MRSAKRKRTPSRGVRSSTQAAQALRQSKAVAREVIAEAIVVNGNDHSGRVLIDRFGHVHTRNVLRIWPDRVKEAMGLHFVDQSDLAEAEHAHR